EAIARMASAWSLPIPPLIHLMPPLCCSFGRAAGDAAHDTDETESADTRASEAKRAVFIFMPPGLYQSAGLPRRATVDADLCNLVRLMFYAQHTNFYKNMRAPRAGLFDLDHDSRITAQVLRAEGPYCSIPVALRAPHARRST